VAPTLAEEIEMQTSNGAWLTAGKRLPLGWKLLFLAGLLFIPGGLVWILQWQPTPGPYMVGERYPFGGYVEAWEVSMGFGFAAFGMLFAGASQAASKWRSRRLWIVMLISFALLMFPHGLIGVVFVLDDPTLGNLGVSAIALPFSLAWLGIVTAGFILSGKEVFGLPTIP